MSALADDWTPLRFRLRTEGTPTPAHETLRVFVNGASAGLLTLRLDEAAELRTRLDTHDELVAALRKVSETAMSHPYAGTTCGEIARAVLAKVNA